MSVPFFKRFARLKYLRIFGPPVRNGCRNYREAVEMAADQIRASQHCCPCRMIESV